MAYVIPALLAGVFCLFILLDLNLSVSQRLLIFGSVLFVLFMMVWYWERNRFYIELANEVIF
ncbi:hypothetical protein GCM10010965_27580 [Caldalkalibacillus thermarum]|nr:hypothetical protein GCM10010965_27580 [Caldalkalibacillus thermarum]